MKRPGEQAIRLTNFNDNLAGPLQLQSTRRVLVRNERRKASAGLDDPADWIPG